MLTRCKNREFERNRCTIVHVHHISFYMFVLGLDNYPKNHARETVTLLTHATPHFIALDLSPVTTEYVHVVPPESNGL